MKEVIIVVAAAEDGAMGLAGDLPWHLPDDFKHFKQTTSGYPIIMGRKTLESFPKALPNRDHIVVTPNEAVARRVQSVLGTLNSQSGSVRSIYVYSTSEKLLSLKKLIAAENLQVDQILQVQI